MPFKKCSGSLSIWRGLYVTPETFGPYYVYRPERDEVTREVEKTA
jgi:hypothetical protein